MRTWTTITFVVCLNYFVMNSLSAQDYLDFEGVRDVKIGAQWFLAYQAGEANADNINEFMIRRGYINVYKRLGANLTARITPDVSVDHEGDGRGDVELRLKYAHLIFRLPDHKFFSKAYFEFGLVHRPWIDFEQRVNSYRVQGTMFLERTRNFNSADFGVTFVSLLGGEIDAAYQKRVNKAYPGKYGSLALGVYNGGGYHAIEENTDKSIEGRLSLRPLPGLLPGLQVHYTGAFGKGNTAYAPDWVLNAGMVSYEAHRFIFTGQYYDGLGNASGSYVDERNKAKPHHGFSFFGEIKFPAPRLSLFARYDNWSGDHGADKTERMIAGLAMRFAKSSKVVLDYDLYSDKTSNETKSAILELAMEVKF